MSAEGPQPGRLHSPVGAGRPFGCGSRGGGAATAWAGEGRGSVDMGLPILEPEKIPTRLGGGSAGPVLDVPLEVAGETFRISSISMGNPHAVLYVDDPDTAPVETLGPRIENHSAFPHRVNVEFVTPVSRTRIRQRTWERGTGETLACGSGACAVAVVSMLRGAVDRRVTIELRGGELEIEWAADDAHIFMTGPATEVYRGTIPVE